MDIIVCMKWTPDTSEADLAIAGGGKDIKKDDLSYDMNDWDRFAIEEAVLIKEKTGGKVIVVTVAPEDAEEMLRESLARGADEAFHIWDEAMEASDGFATARILAQFIRNRPHDLVLTGTLADDNCSGQTGGMLAAMLGIPVATLASGIQVEDGKVKLRRELEGGLYEAIEMDLPCVISVATGLNEPRFVSIRAVRKVASLDIPVLELGDVGLDASQVGSDGSRLETVSMSLPPEGEGAEIIKGKAEEAAARLAEILKEKGGIG
ncbi:electron transfer flavoprotein subunit beta/FixA family protein [Desulfomonile tiedjei]|uniref:Electron transfer flavoprotein subunit beta n=1 Tax=Desulfomonile tiedjei (strain ATCC 49306 / DSM 6799 / DCB-1) TaxID=706587 RepID=I4C5C4_DESTA|nr:electron transfer flavoprotein subunit beta/FixA family protein [Desulfomonile tiedjei]AFM24765.1 electron transfer flavoprotein, beta subunit [Desulfomonile tiedjei DSM 6799]